MSRDERDGSTASAASGQDRGDLSGALPQSFMEHGCIRNAIIQMQGMLHAVRRPLRLYRVSIETLRQPAEKETALVQDAVEISFITGQDLAQSLDAQAMEPLIFLPGELGHLVKRYISKKIWLSTGRHNNGRSGCISERNCMRCKTGLGHGNVDRCAGYIAQVKRHILKASMQIRAGKGGEAHLGGERLYAGTIAGKTIPKILRHLVVERQAIGEYQKIGTEDTTRRDRLPGTNSSLRRVYRDGAKDAVVIGKRNGGALDFRLHRLFAGDTVIR